MEYFEEKRNFVEYFKIHGFWFGQKIWNVGPPIKSTTIIKIYIRHSTNPIDYTCNFVQKFEQTKWTTSTTQLNNTSASERIQTFPRPKS